MKSFRTQIDVNSLVEMVSINDELLNSPNNLSAAAKYNMKPLISGFEVELASKPIKRGTIKKISESIKDKAEAFSTSDSNEASGMFSKLGVQLDKAASNITKVASDSLGKLSNIASGIVDETNVCSGAVKITLLYGKRARRRHIGNVTTYSDTVFKTIENAEIQELACKLVDVVKSINDKLEIDVIAYGKSRDIYAEYKNDPEYVGSSIKELLTDAANAALNILNNEGHYDVQLAVTKRLNTTYCKIKDIDNCGYDEDMAGYFTHEISVLAYGENYRAVPLKGFIGNCGTQAYVSCEPTLHSNPTVFVTEHYSADYLIMNCNRYIGISTGAIFLNLNTMGNVFKKLEDAESDVDIANTKYALGMPEFESELQIRGINNYSSQIDIIIFPNDLR